MLEKIVEIIRAADEANPKNSVLADLCAAQGMLESGFGKSTLSSLHNNYFGIKGTGNAGSVSLETKEFVSGKWIKVKAPFRAYKTPADSFRDHTKFLMVNSRYKPVLEAKTFPEAAEAIQKAGYATDPNYAEKLTNVYKDCILPYREQNERQQAKV